MANKQRIRYLSLDHQLSENRVLPKTKGTYALLMCLKQIQSIRVGKLGTFEFNPGYYLYFGSAFGPGGLKARVGRHQACNKTCRWHIDYLRRKCSLAEVWYSEKPRNLECIWAETYKRKPGISAPVAQFGSSDCGCFSHLFYSAEKPEIIQPSL